MRRALAAGGLYFMLVFVLGMGLGAVRILLLEPSLGAVGSVLAELPFMLAASWFVCGRLIRYLSVPASVSSRLAMGASAFSLLMAAELALDLIAMGATVAGHFAAYQAGAPLVGMVGRSAFALFPLLQTLARGPLKPTSRRIA